MIDQTDRPRPMGSPDDNLRAAEAVLLRNLHAHQAELKALFEKSSDHWGFEDPVYRFYHQLR